MTKQSGEQGARSDCGRGEERAKEGRFSDGGEGEEEVETGETLYTYFI